MKPIVEEVAGSLMCKNRFNQWLAKQKIPTRRTAFRWAIQDGAKLDKLTADTSSLLDGLFDILPMDMKLYSLRILVGVVADSTAEHSEILRQAAQELSQSSAGDSSALKAAAAAALNRRDLAQWELGMDEMTLSVYE
ncbi:hypothetical protein TWF694_011022 [Orbilia ellipsospora]|uniref:Uncharacterized protein n=1 Tax=Orbilia ellipsospora TaxID=2528407 RepID=A0AAV9X8X8_9PEZI